MGSKRKNDFEPYWQDKKDWLCAVEFLPNDDLETRLYSADIIGYLVGYAHLTNTRTLGVFGGVPYGTAFPRPSIPPSEPQSRPVRKFSTIPAA